MRNRGIVALACGLLACVTGCSAAAPEEGAGAGNEAMPAKTPTDVKVTMTSTDATTTSLPMDCNDASNGYYVFRIIAHSAGATDAANGNWRVTPNNSPAETPDQVNYESALWSTVGASNGYEYLLHFITHTSRTSVPSNYQADIQHPIDPAKFQPPAPWDVKQAQNAQTTPVMSTAYDYFFGVGVAAQGDSWLTKPPAAPRYPDYGCFNKAVSQCTRTDATGATVVDAACTHSVYSGWISKGVCSPYSVTASDWQNEYNLSTTNYSVADVRSQAWQCALIQDENGKNIDFFPLMDEHDPGGPPW